MLKPKPPDEEDEVPAWAEHMSAKVQTLQAKLDESLQAFQQQGGVAGSRRASLDG